MKEAGRRADLRAGSLRASGPVGALRAKNAGEAFFRLSTFLDLHIMRRFCPFQAAIQVFGFIHRRPVSRFIVLFLVPQFSIISFAPLCSSPFSLHSLLLHPLFFPPLPLRLSLAS